MKPHAVTVTVTVGDTYNSPVRVERRGHVRDQGGERYSSSLPLTDMPAWLAEFVADQTEGLIPDETGA